MTRNPRPKLFCFKCNARAQGSCACGAPYVPAHVAAAKAVAEHPEQSDRAIAKETGIPRATIQRARTGSTGSNEPVKRIGLDGKIRRLPTTPDHPTPSDLKHVPLAVELAERVASYLRELKREASYHGADTSPRRINQVMYDLLTEIFAGISSPAAKAQVCGKCASEWEIDETKLTEDVIDRVRKTAQAWSDLLEKLEATADSCRVADVAPVDNPLKLSGAAHLTMNSLWQCLMESTTVSLWEITMGEAKRRKTTQESEAINLFDDNLVSVIISRPERRSFTYRKAVPGIASDIANAKPPKLCFDFNCENEVHTLNVFMFVSTDSDPRTTPIVMAACEICSKKSNEEILKILRTDFARRFDIDPVKPLDTTGVAFVPKMVTTQTIHGIPLATDSIDGHLCRQAVVFAELLKKRGLPRFVFVFPRGHNSCFVVTQQLYLDFEALGIENRFTYKEGFSSMLRADSEPIGLHRWVEMDGCVIDGSGGAFGNPIWFQRAEDYYSDRKLTDIRNVTKEEL